MANSTRSKSSIHLNDPLVEAGRVIFARQFRRMKRRHARSRDFEDVESVRRVRSALGRMRRILKLIPDDCQPQAHAEIYARLRRVRSDLGQVRDLDVLMIDLREFGGTLPPEQRARLQAVIDRFAVCRRSRQAALNGYFDSMPWASFRHQLERYSNALLGPGFHSNYPSPPLQVRHFLPPLLHQCLAEVRAYHAILPECDDRELHELRQHFKQLRYSMEHFVPILGASAGDFLRAVMAIQEVLGGIQDVAVCVEKFSRLEDLTADQAELFEAYRADRLAEQERLRQQFNALWTRFNSRATQRLFSDSLLVLR